MIGWAITVKPSPAEDSITGLWASATTLRTMWINSDFSEARCAAPPCMAWAPYPNMPWMPDCAGAQIATSSRGCRSAASTSAIAVH